jgi:hypothetical protein
MMRGYSTYIRNEKAREFIDRNFTGILLIAAIMLICSVFIDEKGDRILYLVLVSFFTLVFLVVKATTECIVFGEQDLTVTKEILGIKLNGKKYPYEGIYKFILSRNFGVNLMKRYSLYMDRNDRIIKLMMVRDYRHCIGILGGIKNRAGKLVYDATDEDYITEDDLFRNYYKLKNMVWEVKDEK